MERNSSPAQVTVTESGNGPYGQIVTAGHHVQGADEPERRGGHDTGLTPFEYLLAALGACTAITIRMYAERHGYALDRVSVALSHQQVTSKECEIISSVRSLCPVRWTLTNGRGYWR